MYADAGSWAAPASKQEYDDEGAEALAHSCMEPGICFDENLQGAKPLSGGHQWLQVQQQLYGRGCGKRIRVQDFV